MTNVADVPFAIDGFPFVKSVDDVQDLIHDLEWKIWAAKYYGNLSYDGGRLTKEDVRFVLQGSGLLHALDNDGERAATVDEVWEQICCEAGPRYIRLTIRTVSDDEPDDEPQDLRTIDIRDLRIVLGSLLRQWTEDDSFTLGACYKYLDERLYNALMAAARESQ